MINETYIGKPVNRVDGPAKVTGSATYAAEPHVEGLLYGVVVNGTVAKGRITRIDTSHALRVPGVAQVFTHENRPDLPANTSQYEDMDAPGGAPFRPLYDERIEFSGQPIALVVAETFEQARYASALVEVEYAEEPHETDLQKVRDQGHTPNSKKFSAVPARGDADKALAASAVKIEAEYTTPAEHHNPMEMHGSTVILEADGSLTVYDKTQGVLNTQSYISSVFGLPKDRVHVLSPFVGGAFGSGLRPQYQLFFAVMAALALDRSVRVVLTRQQMFTFGHRPETIQRLALGASKEGKLEAVIHEVVSETSRFEDYAENVVDWSGSIYGCDNVRLDYKVAPLNVYTPLDMRAPGATSGVYALESAIDELAVALDMDPLELRVRNYTSQNGNEGKPYSSNELRACYRQGAERFGWKDRNPKPRSMRDGRHLIGWGMATGQWEAMQKETSAEATLTLDGKLTVATATADIGTGTYTVMTQVAAEAMGLPIESVTAKLGDSTLPQAYLEGGSTTAASVGTAILKVCDSIRRRLFEFAQKLPNSPFAVAGYEEAVFENGEIFLKSSPSRRVSYADAMRHGGVDKIEEQAEAKPDEEKQKSFSRNTHSAAFVEVRVDEEMGTIGVPRVVSAIAAGRILNPKTARSQILGGVVWGISMALHEESRLDHRLGRFMNHNYAEYHIPVNLDIHHIDVVFVEEEDLVVNPLGVKGVGEIGIVGVAAAVANAVYHATGKRIRDLPITLDKLL